MATVHFQFGRHLSSRGFDTSFSSTHGPIFTQWLPNGEKDAIAIPTDDQNAELKVWFVRRGRMDGNQIIYDQDKREIDPAKLTWNRRLDAGPISGILILHNISDLEGEALIAGKRSDPSVMKIGKRVAKLLPHSLRRLVAILKVNFGQYWLEDVEDWDSRTGSLSSFCAGWCLRWSLDGGSRWESFTPDESVVNCEVNFRSDYSFYLGESDWRSIAALCSQGYRPKLAAELLSRAHQLFDEGQLKYAIIDGVSALEISISDYVKSRFAGRARELLLSDAKAGDTRRLPVRTALIAGMIPTIEQSDLDKTLKVIELRNKIVHEGADASPGAEVDFQGLRQVVAGVLGIQPFKFPTVDSGVCVMPPDN